MKGHFLSPVFFRSLNPASNLFSFLLRVFFAVPGILFLVIVSFAGTVKGEAGGAGLRASLDRESARLGSTVVLDLSYVLPEGSELAPGPEVKGLEGLTVIDIREEPGRIKVWLLLDRLGSWKTGDLSLAYLDRDGSKQELNTEPVSVIILSNLGEKPEEAQLKPVQGIIPLKPVWLKYLPWIAVPAGILLSAAGLFWWSRRIRGSRAYGIHQDPPHVRAKKQIDTLEAEGLFEKGYVKEFYFRLSEIIRRYLEELRGFPALEYTTQEIAVRVDNEKDRSLIPLLRRIDLVKFSDVIPSQAVKEEEIRMAVSYIQETGNIIDVQAGEIER